MLLYLPMYIRTCVLLYILLIIFMYRRRFEEGQEVYVCVADSLPPDLTDLAFRLHL